MICESFSLQSDLSDFYEINSAHFFQNFGVGVGQRGFRINEVNINRYIESSYRFWDEQVAGKKLVSGFY